MKTSIFKAFCAMFLGLITLQAQDFNPKSSAAIHQSIQQLNFLGNVLYIAAHPDDENTRLISYLSNYSHANTSYLSLTRGDGGQNLIGTEIRALLGVLRTQELLAARNIDGGHQYFTRANDFGFSKHPDETLEIWNKEAVLSDVVKTIRQLRPDIIINRFDHRTPGSTHGHHTSSALLSMEAFDLAATDAFPSQLNTLSPWQPKRVFFNTSWWFYGSEEKFSAASKKGLITLDVGVYYPSLGISNNEIASLASSQHLCQGFGRLNQRGAENEYLEFLKGEFPNNASLFDGIDTTWNRIPEGLEIQNLLNPIQENFNFNNPASHLKDLLTAYQLIKEIKDPFWKEQKMAQIKTIIAAISGLYMDFLSPQAYASPGERMEAVVALVARNAKGVNIKNISLKGAINLDEFSPKVLSENQQYNQSISIKFPEESPYTNPYWLNEPATLGMYKVTDPTLVGKAESPAAVSLTLVLDFNGILIDYELPLVYRHAKPDKGELWELFKIAPKLSLKPAQEVVLFPDTESKEVQMTLTAKAANQSGQVSLSLPSDWSVSPLYHNFNIKEKGASSLFTFTVSPPEKDSEVQGLFEAATKESQFNKNIVNISYDHIPSQVVLETSSTKFVRLNIQKRGSHIGYIMGAGDKIPESLEAIGYVVHLLAPEDLGSLDLSKYQSIILGIRALNVIDGLALNKNILGDYVKNGGVLISQYNTAARNSDNLFKLAPYPLYLSRERVTRENAPVSFIDPKHPVLSFPNKIDAKDFEGWVQERGLYFPNKWDKAYRPILEMKDGNEAPTQGSLLVAPFGKGHFIYTGLSFFRELPAGVPGAYRLFTNMISMPQNIEKQSLKN